MSFPVALLAEGVDRNWLAWLSRMKLFVSPSSRRAWIEIAQYHITSTVKYVALLAEGVDRNFYTLVHAICFEKVALLAEGVDRNKPADDE